MVVSVLERRPEMGLRRGRPASGASRKAGLADCVRVEP
jgi:hypothetical protein